MRKWHSTLFIAAVATAGTLLSSCVAASSLRLDRNPPPTHPVRVEKGWIPLKDGIHLAVTYFMPDDLHIGATTDDSVNRASAPAIETGGKTRYPVILEYLPYRKDDDFSVRDYNLHSYFARRGYVSARVDIRGTGSSEGETPAYEYTELELQDGMEIIAWLARQSWSSGNVGMMGISWGGFNSIQLAMRRPPALKAIIAIAASDALFKDDIHYIDGMMHVDEFSVSMDVQTSMLPSPGFVMDEKSLISRFDAKPWFLTYLHHQRDHAFWQVESLGSNYDQIQIPSFVIGGFLDGYKDSIPRMLENVKAPIKALLGPWNHAMPHSASPGPEIEWRKDAVRWWDHWLKGMDTGIMKEPILTVYMRDSHKPNLDLKTIPGHWRHETSWPPQGAEPETLYFNQNHDLTPDLPATKGLHKLNYNPASGVEAGLWWGELTEDQRRTDEMSLTYDTPPLREELSILGLPLIKVFVSTTAKQANWFFRLSDVAPDGSVTMVTGGGINGSHRKSMAQPVYITPGSVFPLEVKLHMTSWVFPPGHKIRVSISNSQWPMIFPTPYAMTTSLYFGKAGPSLITLPKVPREGVSVPQFDLPEPSELLPGTRQTGGSFPGASLMVRNPQNHSTQMTYQGHEESSFPWGSIDNHEKMTYSVQEPTGGELIIQSSVLGEVENIVRLKDKTLTWRGELEFRGDADFFYYQFTRRLFNDSRLVRERTWKDKVRRDHQ